MSVFDTVRIVRLLRCRLTSISPANYYGKLWEIKTLPQAGGTAIQDVKQVWDAGSNLTQRQNLVSAETENFSYDYLDKLTLATTNSVTSPYTESFSYDLIGNLTSKNGVNYAYGVKPHAVTAVGATSYVYDNNGNMTTRGAQTLTWDVENRPLTVTGGASFIYDGDGNRVKKTEGGQTTVYINKYYEKNVTTGVVTTHYFLGGKQIALRQGTTLSYIMQDFLGSTWGTADASGNSISTLRYFPFGDCRFSQGTLPTDEKFTGQRLDGTGLYYYGARYYDANIGRFISPDTIIQSYNNPQTLNRYSYCTNNPLKYVDTTGHELILAALTLGARIGVLFGAGIYAATTSDFSWGGLAGAAVTGVVTGLLATIAPVASAGLLGTAVAASMAGAVGYLAGEGTEYLVSPQSSDPTGEGVALSMAYGYISGGMASGISTALAPFQGGIVAVTEAVASNYVDYLVQTTMNIFDELFSGSN